MKKNIIFYFLLTLFCLNSHKIHDNIDVLYKSLGSKKRTKRTKISNKKKISKTIKTEQKKINEKIKSQMPKLLDTHKSHVMYSKFSNVKLTLEQNPNCHLIIKEMETKDNFIYLQDTNGQYLFNNQYIDFSSQFIKMQIQPKSPNILNFFAKNFKITNQQVIILTDSLNGYIDCNNYKSAYLSFAPNYKIFYETLIMTSTTKLEYYNQQIKGTQISIKHSNFDGTITAAQLIANIATEHILISSININAATFHTTGTISSLTYQNKQIHLINIILNTNDMKITISNGFLNIDNQSELKLQNIHIMGEKFDLIGKYADCNLKNKTITIYNVQIKINNLILNIEKCILDADLIMQMHDIKVESTNNKQISNTEYGIFNLKTKTINLQNGNLQY